MRANAVRARLVDGSARASKCPEIRTSSVARPPWQATCVPARLTRIERRPPQGGAMKGMRMQVAGTIVVAGLALGLAASAAAQGAKPAGVVTSLQGTANLQRVSTADSTPQVQALKFRDEVRVQDRITTGDQSLARILMGGKAVVTVREHSTLTITDTQGTATIDITAGKIALTVARERMAPGERIDIKTPNAVAGVRGTAVIAEVGQFTAQGGGPRTITRAQGQAAANDYKVNLKDAPQGSNAQITDKQVEQAANSAAAAAGG